jgi:hypothetical protein
MLPTFIISNRTQSGYRTLWVLMFFWVFLLARSEAQVLKRVPVEQASMNLDQSKWGGALAFAWEQVALLEADDALQVGEIRARVVEGLIELGEIEEAEAAANRLTGLAHYQLLAKAANAVEGEEQERLKAKAERGFDFLSHRNQEQLVSDMVIFAVSQGWEAVEFVLARCLDVEARLIALGKVAAIAGEHDEGLFERCVKAIREQSKGLNRLGQRYAAVAMTEAVEGWVKGRKATELGENERWYELALSASDVAVGTPNAEEIYARLAQVLIHGGKREQGVMLYEKASLPFKQTRAATPERMELMRIVTQVADELGEGRLSTEWVEQVIEEADLADAEWKWEVMIQAGRIVQMCGQTELAMKFWKSAGQVAAKDSNAVVLSVCLALLALEAQEVGLWEDLGWIREWDLVEGAGC